MVFKRFVILIVSLTASLGAQERIEPRSSFVVNFDFARFKNDDSTKFVELYFACFPSLVTLNRVADGYRGYVELQLAVRDMATQGVILTNRSLVPVMVRDTSGVSYSNTLVGQLGYVIPTGSHRLEITAIDSLAPSRRDTLSLDLDIVTEKKRLATSDLELCSNIKQSTNTSDPFYKNFHEVIPNPTLLFGSVNHPVIFHYLELYNLNVDETYTVKTILADTSGKPIQESSRKRKYKVANSIDVGTTSAVKLPSGKYRFQAIVLNASSEPLVKIEKAFYAYNPQLSESVVSNALMQETSLSGLSGEELAHEFDQARYLATQKEIKTFSEISSPDGRREFLGKFWSEVEAGKIGYPPIRREEYLLRVKRANEQYRAHSREGWRTDRGRVQVLYGAPDEIDRRPSSEGGKPHEIWSYYQVENGVVFVFVDRTGFGDYVLVHSTKRGELRDDNWQRLLQ
jgi:GWxTD domain-containing protein